MVILIGGESCTGKTVMAQKLRELYKISYLSIDHLKMGLIRGGCTCAFTTKDSNELISACLWGMLKGIIMTNIENNQNIIIEGCYLFPNRLQEFTSTYSQHIISVFLGFSQNYIEQNFVSGILAHRCDIETRNYDEDRTITQLISEHKKLKLLCQQYKAAYFEIDENYEKEIAKIYQWIDLQVKNRRG